jgi:hypothetical protein
MHRLLEGVDAVDWAALEHAYGKAHRVPEWLAGLLEPETCVEALGDLDMAIYHQGGAVYSAGAAAVPFLIRLAVDPSVPDRFEILGLLARFARLVNEMHEPWRSRPAAVQCRDAVYGATDVFRALLDEVSPAMRTGAVDVLAELLDHADLVAGDLMSRFPVEIDPQVREHYVLSLSRKGFRDTLSASRRQAVVGWLIDRTPEPPDPLRLAFLIARRRFDAAGVPYQDVLAAYEDQGASARWVGTELGEDRPARAELARLAVARGIRTDFAQDMAEAGSVMMKWRSATDDLLPLIASGLDGFAGVREAALHLLAANGEAAWPWSDAIANLVPEGGRTEALAVWALARLVDPRAVPSVQRSLAGDPGMYPFGATHYTDGFYWLTQDPGIGDVLLPLAPYADSLLPAIRLRLRPEAPTPLAYNLCEALRAFGERAVDALPELQAMLGTELHAPVCGVIAGLGPAAVEASDKLRTVGDSTAAWVLYRVTGDPEPLLEHLGGVDGDEVIGSFSDHLADLGPLAIRYAPQIERALIERPHYWPTWRGVKLANAHFRVTGDPRLCLDVFDAALDPLRHNRQMPVSRQVLRYLTDLGPAADRFTELLTGAVNQDERLVYSGGWRGIAEDDEARALAAAAIAAATASPR